jgi:hypothetical protein
VRVREETKLRRDDGRARIREKETIHHPDVSFFTDAVRRRARTAGDGEPDRRTILAYRHADWPCRERARPSPPAPSAPVGPVIARPHGLVRRRKQNHVQFTLPCTQTPWPPTQSYRIYCTMTTMISRALPGAPLLANDTFGFSHTRSLGNWTRNQTWPFACCAISGGFCLFFVVWLPHCRNAVLAPLYENN